MATFKLTIADIKTGRTFQKEIKDEQARHFIGMNVGENISGDKIEFPGYDFMISGGSDYCGFPMRKGILGVRKKITILKSVGFKGLGFGAYKRKTVCGHKIHDKIAQINLKVIKYGPKGITESLGLKEEELKPLKQQKKELKQAKKIKEKEEKKAQPAEQQAAAS